MSEEVTIGVDLTFDVADREEYLRLLSELGSLGAMSMDVYDVWKKPDLAQRIMRPYPRWLRAIVTYSYDRYDGPKSEGRSWLYRQFWNFIGDRADDVRLWWNRRPMWRL